ncbi:hypothetical protein ABZ442_15510 [Streptomyces triculaminicus]|uniref:hypothetical protein n=1 Tax=Streptomyces triculaminicus TaxID=2816232 RepID=UPI0033E397E3
MGDEKTGNASVGVELDDQGRILINVPDLVDKLKAADVESTAMAQRRRPIININCPCEQ